MINNLVSILQTARLIVSLILVPGRVNYVVFHTFYVILASQLNAKNARLITLSITIKIASMLRIVPHILLVTRRQDNVSFVIQFLVIA